MRLGIQLAWSLLFSFFVVRAGEDTEWKLINVLIIAGSAVLGMGLTVTIEYLSDSQQEVALSIGIISANVGCVIAAAWNYWRAGGIYKGKRSKDIKSDKTVI
jgi:hypothetical protein